MLLGTIYINEKLNYFIHFFVIFLYQAGLRTLHDAGPELKRTISGNLEEMINDDPEPMHRV